MADILNANEVMKYNNQYSQLKEISDLRDKHLEESIKTLEKKNQEEHLAIKKQIGNVKEELTNKIDKVQDELGNKIDGTSSSIKDTIENTLNEKAGKAVLRVLKWVGGIVIAALTFIFKTQLIDFFKSIFGR